MTGWTNQKLWLLLSAVLSFLGHSDASSACPPFVGRSCWGARNAKLTKMAKVPSKVFIHHTETPSCTTATECAKIIRSIQRHHMDVNGWDDIGYSFLIGGDGKVYEGRGWDHVGAHTKGFNGVSLGIAFIGSYDKKEPPVIMQKAARGLIARAVREKKLTADYDLYGHRQATATTCPGDSLFNLIKKWPHWNPEYIYNNGKCTSAGGVCKDNAEDCAGSYTSGKCPGASNIQCCEP